MGNESNSVDQLTKKIDDLTSLRCLNCSGSHLIEACPFKNKGVPCFRCNKFGHTGKPGGSSRVAEKLDDKLKKVNDSTLGAGIHLSNWRLQLNHESVIFKAVICMETKDSFLRKSKFMELKYAPTRKQSSTVERLLGTEVQTLGSYELHMNIGCEGHYIQCHILNDELLPEEIVLGMDFVSGVEIVISKGTVSVRRGRKIRVD